MTVADVATAATLEGLPVSHVDRVLTEGTLLAGVGFREALELMRVGELLLRELALVCVCACGRACVAIHKCSTTQGLNNFALSSSGLMKTSVGGRCVCYLDENSHCCPLV